ncbi:MAG: indole-3-glycerol phosphate synthase TrpC [bacterium]
MTPILDEILIHKRIEVARKKLSLPFRELEERTKSLPPARNFYQALKQPDGISIIAEIKKASPSRGIIRKSFDPIQIAQVYEQEGASAISVLTDQKFFQGDLDYLRKVREIVSLPLLRKDFIIDEYQIYEARAAGADAVLLIAAALSPERLGGLYSLARSIGLQVLLEVHDRDELDTALAIGAAIIGINNRNLKTFQVDLSVTASLAPLIPHDRVIVSESGIHEASQLHFLESLGVDAVLIGEAFMAHDDIGQAFRKLVGRG